MIFNIDKTDNLARATTIKTAHSIIQTPIFMPVGTLGAIKGLDSVDVMEKLNAPIILGNTYHLYLRPGSEVIKNFGGLHKFANFNGSYLTDSGGFQAFSLNKNSKTTDDGIKFKSHIDGSAHFFSPQKVIDIQNCLNSDIMMVLDDLIALPADEKRIQTSIKRTIEWAKQSLKYHKENQIKGVGVRQNLFCITQGGTDYEARKKCALELHSLDFDGFAIGGLSVGEENQQMYDTIEGVQEFLPRNKPRYLMGVGTPQDIIEGISRGVDMFDCVMPTRNARNGTLFTTFGKFNIKNASYINDHNPVDNKCDCFTCKNFSRGYLNHLFKAKELTFYRLASIHNLHYYLNLVRGAREAILNEKFDEFKKEFYASIETK